MKEILEDILNLAFQIFDISFFKDFSSNLFATLIGVAFGIPIALWLSDFQEKRSENVHKSKILSIAWQEINRNKSQLEDWSKLNIQNKSIEAWRLNIRLRYESWQAFSEGGETEWIKDPNLIYAISESYYLFSATPILGFKLRFFEPFFAFFARISQVFMLIPVQFAKSQMESTGISAKITAKKAVLHKPCFTGGGK